jgi:hypothetical protein
MRRSILPFLEILYPRHPSLRVPHHFGKEVGEACAAQFCISASIEVAVVDGLWVSIGVAEAWCLGLLLAGLRVRCGFLGCDHCSAVRLAGAFCDGTNQYRESLWLCGGLRF